MNTTLTALFILTCITSVVGPVAAYWRGYEKGHAEGHDLGAATGFVRGRRSEREESRNMNF
jgi:hypothetical protein